MEEEENQILGFLEDKVQEKAMYTWDNHQEIYLGVQDDKTDVTGG